MNLLEIFKKKNNPEKAEKIIELDEALDVPLVVPKYKSKGGRPKALTDAHVIQIMHWKAENISNCEIARRLHVTEKTIRRYIKSYTITPPSIHITHRHAVAISKPAEPPGSPQM